ncbi:protocadherin gamma-A9-like [Carlito syrichta]|uniref:Protocadherin gamma-A9-like n=1 Tax=Carlito syrichta TaxID=1868482 RepID=A0A3Q0EDQ5_CARSF|nr:protocadherin gamma-A9-like [Carlito syrichta]
MGSGAGERGRAGGRPVLFPFLLALFCPALSEQIRYRILEEMPKGSVVGNLAKDLGFSVQELPTRKLRVSPEKPYFAVSAESGELLVSSRLDREQICGRNPACALEFEAVAENPLNFYHVNVEIEDINDHTPKFAQDSFELQISESAQPGTRFILEVAEDADIGLNSLQKYKLSPSPSFSLINKEKQDGSKYPELALEKPLDREQQSYHRLVLTALDGGDPPLSGTTELRIQVTDANDNPPIFNQDVYNVSLRENVPPGTVVLQVSATDQDEGVNSEITYSFYRTGQVFSLNSKNGEIRTERTLDFEETKEYSIVVEARDGGGLVAQCTVEISIQDENDNSPEVTFHSLLQMILEDAAPGTLIALIKIHDQDSGGNGEVNCRLEGEVPFKIISSSKNSYKLVTDGPLDREQTPEYNVTIIATDRGKPPLSSSITVTLHIGDVNDNAPVFQQASYVVDVAENNPPGASIAQVSASDPDLGRNGHITYSIVASDLEPGSLSSYVSVSAQSGVVFAQRAFDHEQLRAFELTLQARDQGSPALGAHVSLRVLVGDRNDNAPRVLYPALGPDGSALFDTVPRAAEPGYLVTKVSGPVVPPNYSEGTLPYSYNLCVTHTGKTEFNFLQCSEQLSSGQDVLCGDSSGALFPLCNSSESTSHPDSLNQHPIRIFNSATTQSPADPTNRLPNCSKTQPLNLEHSGFLLRKKTSYFAGRKKEPDEKACIESILRKFRSEAAMAAPTKCQHRGRLILLCAFLGTLWEARTDQIRYSVPEETEKGYIVGNISKDLGLKPRELAERGVRIVSRGRMQLFALNPRGGSLVTAGRIDREELCAQSPRCLVNFKVLVEDRVKLYGIEIEVTDINDSVPKFEAENLEIKINEIAAPGARFPLPEAVDPDVGVNSLQSYQLSPNHYFSLDVQTGNDGTINPELVLERALDREEEAAHHLVLSASDGGDPRRSSTVRIHVTVLDTNDNAPVFSQPIYRMKVPENVPPGTQLLTVTASDLDEGTNGKVAYKFRKINEKQSPLFQLNENTGEISTAKSLDYEECSSYEMEVQAEDGGGLKGRTKVLISVEDVNDNRPDVTITSLFSPVREDAPQGTVIVLFNAHDRDSGKNGQVVCSIQENLVFKLENSEEEYYRLLTAGILDREKASEYNITVTATDRGMPPLSSQIHITLHVTDINDNAPAFSQASYSVYLPENNPRGASIFSVAAHDPDSNENARVIYSLAEDSIQGAPLSSFVSINSDTGVLYALRSFDYEQFRAMQMEVRASDSGNPPLSSNVSLRLFVLDQNDNAPEILYPALPTDGSTGVELAPRSAEPGYLVTKVVAVDRDSGQNAWLSYRLLKASEPGLFAVGLHTGEVRTARALLDRDALKQSLVVAVQDHGQPPLSATATLTVAVADSIPDVLADLGNLEIPGDPEASDLTLYLVVAVAAVSCVFLAFVIMLLAFRLRRWHKSRPLQATSGGLAGVPASHFVGMDGVRAFLQTYSQEVSLTADSGKSHLIFPQPNYADTLISQESCGKSEPLCASVDGKVPIEDTPLAPVSSIF